MSGKCSVYSCYADLNPRPVACAMRLTRQCRVNGRPGFGAGSACTKKSNNSAANLLETKILGPGLAGMCSGHILAAPPLQPLLLGPASTVCVFCAGGSRWRPRLKVAASCNKSSCDTFNEISMYCGERLLPTPAADYLETTRRLPACLPACLADN